MPEKPTQVIDLEKIRKITADASEKKEDESGRREIEEVARLKEQQELRKKEIIERLPRSIETAAKRGQNSVSVMRLECPEDYDYRDRKSLYSYELKGIAKEVLEHCHQAGLNPWIPFDEEPRSSDPYGTTTTSFREHYPVIFYLKVRW